jgi:hypothetical protein
VNRPIPNVAEAMLSRGRLNPAQLWPLPKTVHKRASILTTLEAARRISAAIENGGSILTLEFNLDVIRSSDWVIGCLG